MTSALFRSVWPFCRRDGARAAWFEVSRPVAAAFLVLILAASPACAQLVTPVDELAQVVSGEDAVETAIDPTSAHPTWQKAIDDGITALSNGQTQMQRLEQVRAALAEVRSATGDIVDAGNIKARLLAAELAALGPAPAEGESEPETVKQRRAALETAYGEAYAPILDIEMIYRQADFLIKELDSRIRAQDVDDLLKGGPSPLNPQTWMTGIPDISRYVVFALTGARTGVVERFSSENPAAVVLVSLALAVAGISVLTVFSFSAAKFDQRFWKRERSLIIRWLWIGAGYALRLIVPLIGLYLLMVALMVLGFGLGDGEDPFGVFLFALPMILTLAHWFGRIVFAPEAPRLRLVAVSDEKAKLGQLLCDGLGVVMLAETGIELAGDAFYFVPEALSILSSLSVLAGSALMWSLAGIVVYAIRDQEEQNGSGLMQITTPVLAALARLMQVSAVAAAIAALIGYAQLAGQATYPMVISLGLVVFSLVVLAVILALINAVAGWRHKSREDRPSLLPLVIGTVIFAASVPIHALIWGARETDLAEIWGLVVQGYSFGGVRISGGAALVLLIVFVVGYLATRWVHQFLGKTVLPRTRMDSGGRNAVLTGTNYLGITISALLAVSAAGLDLSNLAIVAGALSVGIGFGMQAVVSNFVSGIILLVERPVKEGDWIQVAGYEGIVKKIAVRATRIETFDRHDVVVPNSELISGVVKNMTLSSKTGRIIVPVGVAYGTDVNKVRDLLLSAANQHQLVLSKPEPVVLFIGFGDSSLDFELRCFVSNVNMGIHAKSDLLFAINESFTEAGIEIPFPQRDLHVRSGAVPSTD